MAVAALLRLFVSCPPSITVLFLPPAVGVVVVMARVMVRRGGGVVVGTPRAVARASSAAPAPYRGWAVAERPAANGAGCHAYLGGESRRGGGR